MLVDEIRIKSVSNKAMQFPEKHAFFYKGYALFVKKTIRKFSFQRFIRWLLKRENIDESQIKGVHIGVFPFQNKNGNGLAGRWSKCGNISVFPRSYEFYRKLVAKHGKKTARSYVKCRARATLIHEILHAKYSSDEKRVRRLTERYFTLYARNPITENFESVIYKILFNQ